MKTTTFLVALASTSVVSASVAARDHGEHAADTTVPTPPTLTSIQLGPTESCLALCSADDVNCRASCVGGASANTDQVNQTYDCISACPQGDGSKAASDAYAVCKDACITSYYLVSQTPGVTPTPAPTSVSSVSTTATGSVSSSASDATKATASSTSSATSASGTGSRTAATSATSTRTSSASGTESAAATSSSPSSDAANGPSFVSAGSLAAIVLAFFAL
ncbi:unnamed protein product [Diplocarpon coronariae]|uniref:Uncharacterized protein n=1 Tax=Diplocarpon coronariae TaxID=2795749 RepID=A0A218YZV8_9HELO|nr:hypothetical protein B2J93_2761 [Marssonina coronariae]